MSATLYDGHTRQPVHVHGNQLHFGLLKPARRMTVLCIDNPDLAGWDGQEDLILVLDQDPEAVETADVTECVLELDGGGTVAIVGFTDEDVEVAAGSLKAEVAYERHLCRRPA